MRFRKSPLFLASVFLLAVSCSRDSNGVGPGTDSGESVPIEEGYLPIIEKCLWSGNKPAAYTVSFDDSRPSHYQLAGPALTERGMKGTFFINTRNIGDNWSGWIELATQGHELASHTYSHPKLTELTEEQQRAELERAIDDIRGHIPGLKSVVSFAYPYGLYNDQIRHLVREYHMAARGGWGLNAATLSDEELTLVHGTGVYPPYDMAVIAAAVDKAVREKAWIMVYFHSVSASGDSTNEIIPLPRYLRHLDDVKGRSDSLWIATMGEVAGYMRLRRDAAVQIHQTGRETLDIALANLQGFYADFVPLTIRLKLPQNWSGLEIVAVCGESRPPIRRESADVIYIDVPVSEKILLTARKSH